MIVTLAYSPGPRQVHEWTLDLPEGTTAAQALQASALPVTFPGLDCLALTVGVWGRRTTWSHVLRELDRVEVYRPLLVDPKVARRERFRKQGARAAGLFSGRRAGAKPGY